MTVVCVRYSFAPKDDKRGWSYVVLAARGGLRQLGSGWSAGSKREAVNAFRMAARDNGWEERNARSYRMRGAA